MINQNKNILIHFVGIGGIGMSGIADVLLTLGYRVSGSDISRSQNVVNLEEKGAQIFIGHETKNIQDDVTVLVYSSAIDETNPEIIEARKRQVPLMRRAEMLAELMRLKHGVAIGGTHGKTTTTSILATILSESGIDPTYIIGGIVSNLNGHAKVGKGEILVAEADESDGSFLLLNPIMSVITNIDLDHMNYYGTERKLNNAFKEFANKVPFYGKCALNANDPKLMKLRKKMKKPFMTFGIKEDCKEANFLASNIGHMNGMSTFDLEVDGKDEGQVSIALPGKHNILNALGAISIAHELGLSIDQIRKSIIKFSGVGRRFQILHQTELLEIIDDYAHHPTELVKTIDAAKEIKQDRELVVIFEPHRYTRTRDCWKDFFHAFNSADKLFIRPIYPASETAIEGINSDNLIKDINQIHPNKAELLTCYEDLSSYLDSNNEKKITVLALGAGAIGRNIRTFVSEL